MHLPSEGEALVGLLDQLDIERTHLAGIAFGAFAVSALVLRPVAGRLADQGNSVLVFPEGTRSYTGEVLPFQPDRPGVDAGALAVDPGSGEVLAWYGGRDHAASSATSACAFRSATPPPRKPGPASLR